MARQGAGYLGSNKIEVSTSLQEIIPNAPEKWTIPYTMYKLSFRNYDPCTVVLNHKTELFLDAGDGFEMDDRDNPITSFIIKESGVRFNWRGGY